MSKDSAAFSPPPQQPARIGKYTILGQIGQGAMGHVYRALDPVLNRHVALKMMTADVSSDPQLSQRFLREAQSAARLNHPNIVTLHDFGEDQGQFYMAMELLEGQDLSAVIRQRRYESLEDKLALIEQACDGLAFAHSMQVVHRDLKPANIHVHTSGRVKIMDFGLARLGGSEMTRAGTIMGSPNYMSPEQVRGERADTRSDVFALGLVLYELLSGRRAFDADTMHAILYKVANVEPEPLSVLCPDLPAILAALVEKALHKQPERRFVDAVEMREALDVCRRVLEGSLDGEAGLSSLRESRTIIEAPASPGVEASAAATISSAAPTRPVIPRRGTTSPIPVVRLGPPPSLPGAGADAKTAVQESASPAAGAKGAALPTVASAPLASGTASSRTPLYVAVGLGLAALAAAVFLALRPSPAPQLQQTDARAAALVAVAVESQLEVARKSFAYKDLQGAIGAAEKALRLDPENVEAKAIRDRARAALDAVEAAVTEAREAARAGDTDKATAALSRVLAQAPDHPVAAELSAQLNSRFESRAEEALRQMKSAADAAQRAGASSLRGYAEAARLARQGEDLLRQKQYTQATQKALEAKTAYDVARASAVDLAARPVAPPATTVAPAPVPTLAVAPPSTAPPATTLAPAAPSVSVPATTLAQSDEALVRRVIGDFERAIEAKDISLYKSLRLSLSADDERKLRAAFEGVRSQEVDLAVESISVEGAQAVARVRRSGRVNGQPVPTLKQVIRLVKTPSGWVIQDIGQ